MAAAPIGASWASGSWVDTAWEEFTWSEGEIVVATPDCVVLVPPDDTTVLVTKP